MNHKYRLRWALVLALAVGCSQNQPAKDTGPHSELPSDPGNTVASVGKETTPDTEVIKSDGTGPVFHNLALNAALKKAKTDGKLVMVDFYADWCTACKVLDNTVWKNEKAQGWLRDRTVAIKVDVEKADAEAEKYNISSLPTLLFLRSDGTEVGRIVGAPNDVDAFLKEATAILAGKKNATD